MDCRPQHHLQKEGRAVAAANLARHAVYALSHLTEAAINNMLPSYRLHGLMERLGVRCLMTLKIERIRDAQEFDSG